MAVSIKTPEEIEILREGGRRLAKILAEVALLLKPGISTAELDQRAEELIRSSGGMSAFKGYRVPEARTPYPATLCVSLNDGVVHGIPKKEILLREGDIVGLDIGMWWPAEELPSRLRKKTSGSLCTDMAITAGVGRISDEAKRLVRVTEEALEDGIRTVRPGRTIGDIGHSMEKHLKKERLGIIRDLAGHGVGYKLHEEPLIPNFGPAGSGETLKEGMVIAIEPMATLGDWRIVLDKDEWTFRTADGSLSAHFEHTIAVTSSGAEVLTKL
jgi:methionyl aminopeptidase